jgi:serine/threonine protein kinase/tetratricopeptide (TPR) repeat protein
MQCPSNAEIDDFVRGILGGTNLEHFERHLDACDACRTVVGLIASRGEPDPAGVWAPITAAPASVGRYTVAERLGAGTMGVVYRARDTDLERDVALKILPPGRARVLREARAQAALDHPHVVTVYEVGEVDGVGFIAMEYVRGLTLDAYRHANAPGWRWTAEAFHDVADALARAHEQDLVHGDVKPANLLIGDGGSIKLADLGLARRIDGTDDGSETSIATPDDCPEDSNASTTGGVGTPAYMAPELFEGERPDPASDQFSLCATFFEALYGSRAFTGDSVAALARASRDAHRAPRPTGTDVPSALHAVLVRGLRTEPAARFPSLAALRDAVDAVLNSHRRRREIRVALASAGVALVLSGAWFATSSNEDEPVTCTLEDLRGRWTPATVGAAQEALTASGQPYAEEVWAATKSKMDAYVADYGRIREAMCASPSMLPSHRRCLQQGVEAFSALAEGLSALSPAQVEHVPAAVHGLPDLDPCAEASSTAAPNVEEPLWTELEADLTRAGVMDDVADYERARALASSVYARAEDAEYGALAARADIVLAHVESNRGAEDAVAMHAERALSAAQAAGDDDAVARASIVLLTVHADDLPRARRWAEFARASIARAGGNVLLSAKVDQFFAGALRRSGAHHEAVVAYRRALERYDETLGPSPAMVSGLIGLASALASVGELDESLDLLERCRTVALEVFGSHHPWMAMVDDFRGQMLIRAGRYEEAEHALTSALQLQSATLGEDSPAALSTLESLAGLRFEQGRLEEARKLFEDVSKRQLAVFGPDDTRRAMTLANLASIARQLGDMDASLAHSAEAIALKEKAGAGDHPSTLTIKARMARTECERGDAGALTRLQRVFETAREVDDVWALGSVRTSLGLCLIERGKPEEASSLADPPCLDDDNLDARTWGDACLLAARAYSTMGKLERARARWDRAADLWKDYPWGREELETVPRP